MSVTVVGTNYQMASVDAVVFPVCKCGKPQPAHGTVDGCHGYDPVRPIEYKGTVAYMHRRMFCRALYRLERAVRALRERLERS